MGIEQTQFADSPRSSLPLTPRSNGKEARKMSLSNQSTDDHGDHGLVLGGKDSRTVIADDGKEEDSLFEMYQNHDSNFEMRMYSESALQDLADDNQRKLDESRKAEELYSAKVQELEEEMKLVN